MKSRCENCGMRKRAEKNPNSIISKIWRWHTGWCPGWKAYQRELAQQLGRSSQHSPPKRRGGATRPAPTTGAPILTDGLGWLECRLVATMPTGDHARVLGGVVAAGVERQGGPLTVAAAGMKYAG